MAHTDDKVYATFPITKFEEDSDGNLVVYGKATDGSVDTDEQIVDPEWSGKALQTWMESGPNVRVQHNPARDPAGRGLKVELNRDGDGAHWVKSLVVEPVAQRLVKHGVLRAYSVGISRPVVERDVTGKARGGVIKGGELFELSLVDRPANRSCSISLVKAEGATGDWSEGDLLDALAKAEADDNVVTKAEDAAAPAGDAEPEADDVAKSADPFKLWQRDRQEWLAGEPARGGAVDGTEYLAKRAAWQKWQADGEESGFGEDGYPLWLAKRDMDPNVGGGTDRDKIAAEDFAGKNRSFPIVTPKDVADAAQSIGRAGDDNYPPEKLKANIIAIAKRKGPQFEAKLPDAWKKGDASKAEKPGGKQCADCNTFNDADAGQCSNCGHDLDEPKDHQHGGDQAAKGQKDCPGCGAGYDADSKKRRCESCGKKLPKATAIKGVSKKCACEGMDHPDGAQFCSRCGAELADDDAAEKNAKPKRIVPDDVKPAGEHREPDGSSTVEQLEPDAGMGTDSDPVKDKVPASVKNSEAPYSVTRMHDALCAAYHADAVTDAYPSLKGVADAIDTDWWQTQVADTAAKGELDLVGALVDCTRAASALKAEDSAILADARAELHKSFVDLHGKSMTPGNVTPGQFQRPYIAAGHAPLTARAGQTPRVPPGTHTPDPDQFDRGLITDGHEASSPSSTGGNNPTSTVATGAARQFYSNASRDAARQAMQVMHDHISRTFPDLCPMAASKSVLPADMGDTNRPRPVEPLTTPKAPGEKSAKPKVHKKAKTDKVKALKASAPTLDADLIKSIVTDVTKAIRDDYENQITALKAEIDALGRQPDPTQAPVRGVVRKAATLTPAPVEQASAAEAQDTAAKAQQAAYRDHLIKLAHSPDPATRMRAEAVLEQLLTP
ncbi:hypothetical protein ACWGCW_01000 [Streptomyces sp. NPDC054933]